MMGFCDWTTVAVEEMAKGGSNEMGISKEDTLTGVGTREDRHCAYHLSLTAALQCRGDPPAAIEDNNNIASIQRMFTVTTTTTIVINESLAPRIKSI